LFSQIFVDHYPKSKPVKYRVQSVFYFWIFLVCFDKVAKPGWKCYIGVAIITNRILRVFNLCLTDAAAVGLRVRNDVEQPIEPHLLKFFEAPTDWIGPISSALEKHVDAHIADHNEPAPSDYLERIAVRDL